MSCNGISENAGRQLHHRLKGTRASSFIGRLRGVKFLLLPRQEIAAGDACKRPRGMDRGA